MTLNEIIIEVLGKLASHGHTCKIIAAENKVHINKVPFHFQLRVVPTPTIQLECFYPEDTVWAFHPDDQKEHYKIQEIVKTIEEHLRLAQPFMFQTEDERNHWAGYVKAMLINGQCQSLEAKADELILEERKRMPPSWGKNS